MIPHHSQAILVRQAAGITDREITELLQTIVQAQLEEIARMQQMLSATSVPAASDGKGRDGGG